MMLFNLNQETEDIKSDTILKKVAENISYDENLKKMIEHKKLNVSNVSIEDFKNCAHELLNTYIKKYEKLV